MSILLEALRKSEQGQKTVEAPTIHSEHPIAVVDEPLNKGLMVVLILIALSVIAWITWRQYEPSMTGYQKQETSLVQQEGVIQTPVSTMQPTESANNKVGTTRSTANQPRTPVENYRQATSNVGSKGTVNPDATKSAQAASQAVKPESQITDTGARNKGVTPAEKSAGKDPAGKMRPQPISYWELPDAVRADVPEMKFSVLVYAGEPADRFVLVNGQRMAEGDSYQQGLVVEEIRRDGVVFSYRLYKFLVER